MASSVAIKIKISCKHCGQNLSDWMELMDNVTVMDGYPEDGKSFIEKGIALDVNKFLCGELFYGAEKGDYLIDESSLTNVQRFGSLNGCCGPDGCDGKNVACGKKHDFATLCSDCWHPTFVYFSKDDVNIEVN